MKREEVMAIISSMEMQLAALKELVVAEEVIEAPSTEGLPGSDYDLDAKRFTPDGRELLPEPPKVIYVDIPEKVKKEIPDEDAKLGCQIITSLPDFYNGKCSVLKVHKRYFDNGQPKLFIDIYHVVIEAYDANMKQIGSYTTHWNNLSKFHTELLKRGINTHDKKNWKPKTLLLDLD
jgi:hypothetical protein